MKNRTSLATLLVAALGTASLAHATSTDDSFAAGKKFYESYLYDQAIECFQDCVSQAPDYWEAYQMMAYTYYKQGKRGRALDAANKSLEIHGDNPELRKFVDGHWETAETQSTPGEDAIRGASETSSAETRLPDSIFVNLGTCVPWGPDRFTANQVVGYNGGIGFGWGISRAFQLVADANADTFPLHTTNNPGASGGAMRIITILANARVRFIAKSKPVVPYFIGGLGPAFVNQDSITVAGTTTALSTSNTYGALRLGLGLDFKLSDESAIYVESDSIVLTNNGNSNYFYNSFRLGGKFNL